MPNSLRLHSTVLDCLCKWLPGECIRCPQASIARRGRQPDESTAAFRGQSPSECVALLSADCEATHLQDFDRLSRLALAAIIVYVWLIALGSRIVKRGRRFIIDCRDRRDLSLFRIVWNGISVVLLGVLISLSHSTRLKTSARWLDSMLHFVCGRVWGSIRHCVSDNRWLTSISHLAQ